jgi:hypothetical protein
MRMSRSYQKLEGNLFVSIMFRDSVLEVVKKDSDIRRSVLGISTKSVVTFLVKKSLPRG